MATVGSTNLTLSDWAKRTDPDGKVPVIVELMSETNAILEDAIVIEGNQSDGHKTVVRTGLPTATWRMLNYGVQPQKSTTAPIYDKCGMLETISEVDADLLGMGGDINAMRLSEDRAFIEGMNNQMATAMFYGNAQTDPEQITGLAPRYSDLSAGNGANIIDCGGTGSDNTSVWLIAWDEMTCFLTFPKGSKAGLQHIDMSPNGPIHLQDAAGGKYLGYSTHYKWNVGVVVKDWRYVVRLANIDVSSISSVNLIDKMSQALETIQTTTMGKLCFYMNRTVRTELRRQTHNKTNVNLTLESAGGKAVKDFDGVPVRLCDAILNTEARVV